MAEGVGEDDVAAGIGQLSSGIVALLALGDVGAEQVLILGQAQVSNGLAGSIHEVQVVGGVLVMQENEANLDVGSSGRGFALCGGSGLGSGIGGSSSGGGSGASVGAAGSQAQNHHKDQSQRKNLFHFFFFLLEKCICSSQKRETTC